LSISSSLRLTLSSEEEKVSFIIFILLVVNLLSLLSNGTFAVLFVIITELEFEFEFELRNPFLSLENPADFLLLFLIGWSLLNSVNWLLPWDESKYCLNLLSFSY